MRPAVILALLGLALFLRVVLGGSAQGTFDDRFERADAQLDELSRNIEEDISGPQRR